MGNFNTIFDFLSYAATVKKVLRKLGINTPIAEESHSGQKGYYIHSINPIEKWIILSESETKPVIPTMGDVADDSDPTATIGYEVNDLFSIINGAHYDFCGKITAIAGNKISYNGTLPFNSIDTSSTSTTNHTLFVPKKPTVGLVTITDLAFTTGSGNIAAGKDSFSAGRDNTSGGDYSTTLGRRNFASYCALAFGLDCYALGRYSIAGGTMSQATGEYSGAIGCVAKATGDSAFAINNNTVAQGRYSFAHGLGTNAKTDTMESGGMYNATQENMIVVYGNGTSDSNRHDAYTLDLNGNGTYDGRVKAESLKAERVLNTEFLKQDYFSNGKQPYTVHNYTGFDDLTEPGFYQVMWYHTEVQQGGALRKDWTPWTVMVSVRKYDNSTTDVWQVREAYGPASGKRYWKDIRHGTTSGGVFTWGEWQDLTV